MALFESLAESLGIDGEMIPARYRFSVCGFTGGSFEGVKVVSFCPEEVVFSSGKIILSVKGKRLEIKKYVENEVVLKGEIISVERK